MAADTGMGANPVIHDALSTAQIDVGEFPAVPVAARLYLLYSPLIASVIGYIYFVKDT